MDITRALPEPLKSENWGFLLIPEVLEHIDNKVDFIKGVFKQFNGLVGKVVIIVPNAFYKEILIMLETVLRRLIQTIGSGLHLTHCRKS